MGKNQTPDCPCCEFCFYHYVLQNLKYSEKQNQKMDTLLEKLSLLIGELRQERLEIAVLKDFYISILSRLDQVKLEHAIERQLKDMEEQGWSMKRFSRGGA